MTETRATGYDGLSSRLVPEVELREFLLGCFGIAEHELFVGHDDRVEEDLRDVPQDVVFAAFCTYRQTRGHFAMHFDVGIEGRLADRVGRGERGSPRASARTCCTAPPNLQGCGR
ncbi:hypothetical protein AB0G06_14500 [Nonomuraea dietziae]|uniref:hypothetical protein n=1 Tax=Nonomuraea dietziae TaxID=65515 RepID=UPI0033C6E271